MILISLHSHRIYQGQNRMPSIALSFCYIFCFIAISICAVICISEMYPIKVRGSASVQPWLHSGSNIPYRTINPTDVADNHSGRYFPDFAGASHADYMKLVPETTEKPEEIEKNWTGNRPDERYIDKLLFTYVFKLCDNRKMIGQQRLNSLSSISSTLGRA